ncbi:10795_t:CDS:2, partial [Ambispora leptoticha]
TSLSAGHVGKITGFRSQLNSNADDNNIRKDLPACMLQHWNLKSFQRIALQHADEILEIIMSLKKRERTLCYFNPEYLNKKVIEAIVVIPPKVGPIIEYSEAYHNRKEPTVLSKKVHETRASFQMEKKQRHGSDDPVQPSTANASTLEREKFSKAIKRI